MKILLVYPVPPKVYWPKGLFRSRWVPSGISYIARALIDAGHEFGYICVKSDWLNATWIGIVLTKL